MHEKRIFDQEKTELILELQVLYGSLSQEKKMHKFYLLSAQNGTPNLSTGNKLVYWTQHSSLPPE